MKTTNIVQKVGCAFVLFMLTTLSNQADAQSHNVKCESCKYYQKPADVKGGHKVKIECACLPCQDKKEKERKAKQAEDKRRNDILVVKQKAEAAERERIAKENKAKEEAEKKRKEENIARLKQESDVATRRANEIKGRYKELNNSKGNGYEEEIKELKAYGDEEYIGVKLNEDILWTKSRDNVPMYISRITGTNYFLITDNSKEINNGMIYDMYGKPILIDGYNWIDHVFFDKDNNFLEVKIIEEPYYKASSNDLYLGDAKQHETPIYSTKEELLTVHNAIYEKGKAAFRAKYAGTTGGILVSYQTLRVAKGKLIKTDTKFKVLEKKTGYLFRY